MIELRTSNSEQYSSTELLLLFAKLLDIDELLQQDFSQPDINHYYQKNRRFYHWLHSKEGAMHFPLYLNHKYGEKDAHPKSLYEQAKILAKICHEDNYRNVLEIGCGIGFNMEFLSRELPHHSFTGLDASDLHLAHCEARFKERGNVKLVQADMNVPEFISGSFDLVFAVESMCYSSDINQTLQSIFDALNPGGTFVLFDMLTTGKSLNEEEQKLLGLSAKGYAVNKWHSIEDYERTASSLGFSGFELTDLSEAVMPSAKTFAIGSLRIFERPRRTRLMRSIGLLHDSTIKHAVTGVLTNEVLSKGWMKYVMVETKKAPANRG